MESIDLVTLAKCYITPNRVNWRNISTYEKLSESFIRKFQVRVSWYEISRHQVLSENFIREFQHKVRWVQISEKQTLSEPFIREFQNHLDWNKISAYQTLTEPFINEFVKKINCINILRGQKFSESSIRAIIATIDQAVIITSQKHNMRLIKKSIIYKTCWRNISKYQRLSESLIEEIQDKIKWNEYVENTHCISWILYKNRKKVTKHTTVYHKIINNFVTSVNTFNILYKDKMPLECIKLITHYL